MVDDIVIIDGVRSAFGKFGGVLKNFSSVDIASELIKALLDRSKISANEINEVYLGNCIQVETQSVAGIVARQALLKAGLPQKTTSLTIDRACCSAMTAVQLAFKTLALGEADVIIAGGVENMSKTPLYTSSDIRWGTKLGGVELKDDLCTMGYKGFSPFALDAGSVALDYDITRLDQDRWALLSQKRYQIAKNKGFFEKEIIPLNVPIRKKETILFKDDEFPKPDTTMEKLALLPTIYGSPTVTAGNAPGLDAGGALLLLMKRKKAIELNLKPLATILSVASVADNTRNIASVPATAIQKVLKKCSLTLNDMSLIEINEAFAAMPLVSLRILSQNDSIAEEALREITNVNGGAIAIGHPIGASGARILISLVYELQRREKKYGVCAICGGLGQGDATLISI